MHNSLLETSKTYFFVVLKIFTGGGLCLYIENNKVAFLFLPQNSLVLDFFCKNKENYEKRLDKAEILCYNCKLHYNRSYCVFFDKR